MDKEGRLEKFQKKMADSKVRREQEAKRRAEKKARRDAAKVIVAGEATSFKQVLSKAKAAAEASERAAGVAVADPVKKSAKATDKKLNSQDAKKA